MCRNTVIERAPVRRPGRVKNWTERWKKAVKHFLFIPKNKSKWEKMRKNAKSGILTFGDAVCTGTEYLRKRRSINK
jgi:hypothetical protein